MPESRQVLSSFTCLAYRAFFCRGDSCVPTNVGKLSCRPRHTMMSTNPNPNQDVSMNQNYDQRSVSTL